LEEEKKERERNTTQHTQRMIHSSLGIAFITARAPSSLTQCVRRKSQTKEIKPELVFLRQKFIASRTPGSLLFISGESHRLRIKKQKKIYVGVKRCGRCSHEQSVNWFFAAIGACRSFILRLVKNGALIEPFVFYE